MFKFYVPVVTMFMNDNTNLKEQLLGKNIDRK